MRRRQGGQTLINVVLLTAVLLVLIGASMLVAQSSRTNTNRLSRDDLAIQIADAGVHTYLSRLTEDPNYFDKYVDRYEQARRGTSGSVNGQLVLPGQPWTIGTNWTYDAGALPDSAFNQIPSSAAGKSPDTSWGQTGFVLRVSRPRPGSYVVTVTGIARVSIGTPQAVTRAVEAQARPTSIADFQMVSDKSIAYGSAARTTGKVYTNGDLIHAGTADDEIYGQNRVCRAQSGTVGGYPSCGGNSDANSFPNGAFDPLSTPDFASKFKNPIDFSLFTNNLSAVQTAAQPSNNGFTFPSAVSGQAANLIQFLSDGTFKWWRVMNTGDIGSNEGTLQCTGAPQPVPASGAMYSALPVIVSDGGGSGGTNGDSCGGVGPRPSVVHGQVTIGSADTIYVGGNISYDRPGTDVLGLIANNNVNMTYYTPSNHSWRAAAIAQNGVWASSTCNYGTNPHSSLVYTGSTATRNGGCASNYGSRTYNYDPTLKDVTPPYYPVLSDSWRVKYWREVDNPS